MTNLHRQLQDLYAAPDGRTEVVVDGWRVDAVRDGVIYEVQSTRLRSQVPKLRALLPRWPVVLIHPLVTEKMIVRVDVESGEVLSRRRSPKHATLLSVFDELPSIASLLSDPNLTLEVVLCAVTETRDAAGRPHRWRRRVGPKLLERDADGVVGVQRAATPDMLGVWLGLVPGQQFTSSELAQSTGLAIATARRAAYTLALSGAARRLGRRSRELLYELTPTVTETATEAVHCQRRERPRKVAKGLQSN